MSVETVETETVVTVVEREPLAPSVLRALRNTPAIRVADAHNPEDASQDRWMILDSYREDARSYGDGEWTHGRFSAYEIGTDRAGNLNVGRHDGDWHDARLILEAHPGSYSDYFNLVKLRDSAGKFGAVYYDNLPREMRRLSTDGWPHSSNAMFEVMSVDMTSETAKVRVFAHGPTGDSDFTELGEHDIALSYLGRATLSNKEEFDKVHGLAKNLIPEGTLYERIQDGEMWQVTGYSYTNLKVKRVDNDGKVYGRASQIALHEVVEGNKHHVKLGDSWNDYLLSQPSGETAEMLAALSKVTVSKALKHADSNGYCSETAVALASAGHSLPELRIKGTITLNVDVSTKEYMVLRRLMGATDGDPDQAVANMFGNEAEGIKPNLSLYNRLQHEAGQILPAIPNTGNGENTYDLKAELVWKAPRIRK